MHDVFDHRLIDFSLLVTILKRLNLDYNIIPLYICLADSKVDFLSVFFVAKGCVAAFRIAPITAETKEPLFGLGVHSFRLCLELTGLDSMLLLLLLYASL